MTIEQYGKGPWVVRIGSSNFRGTYRFETKKEAREFMEKNRRPGEAISLSRSRRETHYPLVDVPHAY